ncbi:MAG TPA: outer membrane lipoprotein carrier protein LolA [Rhizomicrobium sp.]|jgi:hypothetical protein|nr:outer membrane lipoprotein carrier protein LolA [Rhizomicrobium sp.]
MMNRTFPRVLALLFCAPLLQAAAPQTIAVGEALRGHFEQTRHLAGFARPLVSDGSFVLVPGKGLIWHDEKPFANVTVITPDGILQIANGQEAMRLPASKLPGLSHLYDALAAAVSGNVEPLKQTFAVQQSGGADAWKIVLTPLHPDSPAMAQLKSLTLTGHHFVDSVEIDKGGGDADHIAMLDQSVAPSQLSADEASELGALRK